MKNLTENIKAQINYATFIRRTPRENYYEKKFESFKSNNITVSEFSPCSPKNGGYINRKCWKKVNENDAKNTIFAVWFKNASFYGASQYYIKTK